MTSSVRRWVVAIGLLASLHPVCAYAEPPRAAPAQAPAGPVDLKDGIAVIAAAKAPIGEAWSLATSVYSDPKLRPSRLDDATARVLAGEPVPKRASAKLRELAELRSEIRPEGTATKRLLSSLASELQVSGLLVVYQVGPAQPRARLFVAARGDFAEPVLWPQPEPNGKRSWRVAQQWLRAQSSRGRQPSSSGSSVVASPWFWGALVAAAGAAVIGYSVTRDDDSNSIHLQGRVSP